MKKRTITSQWKYTLITSTFLFALCILTGGEAYAQHYSNHGVRERMTRPEKAFLIREEARDLSWYDVDAQLRQMEVASLVSDTGVVGSFRAQMKTSEKAALLMDEDKSMMAHEAEVVARGGASLGDSSFGTTYVYGSFRANLSDAERSALENEE